MKWIDPTTKPSNAGRAQSTWAVRNDMFMGFCRPWTVLMMSQQ